MKELIKISCYRCNSHVGSAVSYFIAVHKVFVSSRLICSLMTSSATGRLRLDFHHIKVDFKKSEVVQPLVSSWGFGTFAQGHLSHGIKGGESAGYSLPHLQFLLAQDSNSQPLDYESDSLTIRPQLPLRKSTSLFRWHCQKFDTAQLSVSDTACQERNSNSMYMFLNSRSDFCIYYGAYQTPSCNFL